MSVAENLMSLDLEMNQPSGTIIQVGYIVGNVNNGEILYRGSDIINAQEIITPYIIDLTGISQEQVDNGISLGESYKNLEKIHKKYDCFINPLVWGGGDSATLRAQLGKNDSRFLFGRRYIDVKTLFVSYCIANSLNVSSGLSKSMRRMGLQFVGRKHDALCDAENTFLIYLKLLEFFKKSKRT